MTTRLQPRRSIATIIPLLGTVLVLVLACGGDDTIAPPNFDAAQVAANGSISQRFTHTLLEAGFTGRVGQSLTARLGRPINPRIAEVGRMLWFDSFTGLNDDNSCGGCHSPTNGMGDVGSIAIGIDNNGVVGPGRAGPRNQRRTPMAINTAFYPTLVWNSRFFSASGDPFDNSAGFVLPPPVCVRARQSTSTTSGEPSRSSNSS